MERCHSEMPTSGPLAVGMSLVLFNGDYRGKGGNRTALVHGEYRVRSGIGINARGLLPNSSMAVNANPYPHPLYAREGRMEESVGEDQQHLPEFPSAVIDAQFTTTTVRRLITKAGVKSR